MTQFTIREARPEDFDAIIDLWESAERHVALPDRDEYLATLHAFAPELFLVAEANHSTIGTIIAGWDGWRGHLARLAVNSEHRRADVATALVREAEQRLSVLGARRVYALVDQRNPFASPYWDAAGYLRDDKIVQYSHNVEGQSA